jgi:hypothetical protein
MMGVTPSSATSAVQPRDQFGFMHAFASGAAAGPHADGTVTAVNGDTITVKADTDRAGSNEYTQVTTITLGSNTVYTGGASKASIKVGSHIIAQGTLSSDGKTLTATSVTVLTGTPGSGGCPHGGQGGLGV